MDCELLKFFIDVWDLDKTFSSSVKVMGVCVHFYIFIRINFYLKLKKNHVWNEQCAYEWITVTYRLHNMADNRLELNKWLTTHTRKNFYRVSTSFTSKDEQILFEIKTLTSTVTVLERPNGLWNELYKFTRILKSTISWADGTSRIVVIFRRIQTNLLTCIWPSRFNHDLRHLWSLATSTTTLVMMSGPTWRRSVDSDDVAQYKSSTVGSVDLNRVARKR